MHKIYIRGGYTILLYNCRVRANSKRDSVSALYAILVC